MKVMVLFAMTYPGVVGRRAVTLAGPVAWRDHTDPRADSKIDILTIRQGGTAKVRISARMTLLWS